jgi:hypothetical protein
VKKGSQLETYSFSTGAPDVTCVNQESAFVCLSPILKMFYYTRYARLKSTTSGVYFFKSQI